MGDDENAAKESDGSHDAAHRTGHPCGFQPRTVDRQTAIDELTDEGDSQEAAADEDEDFGDKVTQRVAVDDEVATSSPSLGGQSHDGEDDGDDEQVERLAEAHGVQALNARLWREKS